MDMTAFTPKLFTTLRGYSLSGLRTDLIAGLTVAIVALPLSMALAIASGASPAQGLVTAVIAGFVISLLGGSRVQIGGPTGAFVVVVFNIIATHGYDGLVLATLMAGVILIVAGYTRMGRVIKFIPHPVVTGFTTGIAVIIASSQVKDFLGLRMEEVPADFLPKWAAYFTHLDTTSLATLAVGVGALAILIGLRRFAPKMPAYLIAIAAATLIVTIFHVPVDTIGERFPDISTGLPAPSLPDLSFERMADLMPAAFTIAFLAGIEALLSAVVADGMTGYRHRPNQELVAQGAANVASALFAGLPATGAIARTATNIRAGGQTPVAGIAHAGFILLFILFAMDLIAFVPMAALAAILFMVAWGMSELRHFRYIFRMGGSDRYILLLTFFLTVLVDLTVAIGVGVILASLLFIHDISRTVDMQRSATPMPEEEDTTQRESLPEGVEVFRINGPVFFGVTTDMIDTLHKIGQMPRILILRMRYVPYLDTSGVSVIGELVADCRKRGTLVIISGLQPRLRLLLQKGGVSEGLIYAEHYDQAIEMAAARLPQEQDEQS